MAFFCTLFFYRWQQASVVRQQATVFAVSAAGVRKAHTYGYIIRHLPDASSMDGFNLPYHKTLSNKEP